MHYVHKISLMIHTASYDDFLESQGIPSYFTALLKNLSQQTIKEFELVYVDTFYEDNKEKFDSLLPGLKFIVKHIPVHKDHRYWYDKGYTYISAAKNTGILHADGEICVTCDDAEFFPSDFLETYLKHHRRGCFMLGMHHRMKSIKTENGIPVFPIKGEFYINDHRFNTIKAQIHKHKDGGWAFAGTSFGLQDALTLNGFNERMDGCKSLEDCDFGNRLQLLGREFVQDKKGIFYIVDHPSYSEMKPINLEVSFDGQKENISAKPNKKKIDNLIAVENFGVLKCSTELNEIRANSEPITNKHLQIIKRETLRYRKFDPLAPDNAEKFEIWKNVPTFDLTQQRKELRSSSEWRW